MERQLQSRLGFHKRRGLSCSPAPAVGSGLVVMPPRVPQSWLFRSRLEHRSCRQGHGRSGHRGAADGPRVREVKFPDVAQIIADWFPLCSVQTAVAHEATYPARKSEYGPALSSFIDLGSALSGLDYQNIILRRASFQGRVAALFQGIDLLLVPAQSLCIADHHADGTPRRGYRDAERPGAIHDAVRHDRQPDDHPSLRLHRYWNPARVPVCRSSPGRGNAGARRLRLSDSDRLAPQASRAAERLKRTAR